MQLLVQWQILLQTLSQTFEHRNAKTSEVPSVWIVPNGQWTWPKHPWGLHISGEEDHWEEEGPADHQKQELQPSLLSPEEHKLLFLVDSLPLPCPSSSVLPWQEPVCAPWLLCLATLLQIPADWCPSHKQKNLKFIALNLQKAWITDKD